MATTAGRPLVAAIVGAGYIGAVHAEALRRVGGEVRWIVGRPGADIATRAAMLRVPRYTDRVQEALDDADVDVVHVCTPNALHVPLARSALERGKHLICEKPLATTAAEAAELVRIGAAAGVVAGVAYCYRYYPLVQQARQMIEEGSLGRLHHVRGLYLADELLHGDYLASRFDPAITGASLAMADVGIHWCDLAEHITGQRIVELLADVQTTVPQRLWRRDRAGAGPPPDGVATEASSASIAVTSEDCLSLLLRFAGGARGTLTVSQVSAGHKNWLTVSVDGAAAGLDWNQEQPNTLTVRRVPAWEGLPKDPLLLSGAAAVMAGLPGGHPEGYADAFRNLIGSIYGAIERYRQGQTPGDTYPTLADGHHSMVLVEAALQSAREGRWVSIPQRRTRPANNHVHHEDMR